MPGFQPQPQVGMQGPIMIDPTGKAFRAAPGTNVKPGSMTPGGESSLYAPTGQEKTAAGRAQIVLKQLPRTIGLIDQSAAELGPAMGRWSAFMQGEAGFNNPKMASLHQDLMMMSSAVALCSCGRRAS